MFHPGSTAVHTFTIPFNKDSLSEIIVSYWQDDHIIFERTLTSNNKFEYDQAFSPMKNWTEKDKEHKSRFFIQLTEDESLLFYDYKDISIQINVKTNMNSRHVSKLIKRRKVGIQLHREVIRNA